MRKPLPPFGFVVGLSLVSLGLAACGGQGTVGVLPADRQAATAKVLPAAPAPAPAPNTAKVLPATHTLTPETAKVLPAGPAPAPAPDTAKVLPAATASTSDTF